MNGATASRVYRPATLRAMLTPLLICVITVPSGLFYMGLASSTAMGSMVVSCLALLLSFTLLKFSEQSLFHASLLLLLFIIAILMHLFAVSGFGAVNLSRGAASLLPFCNCIAGGWAIAALFAHARSADLTRALKQCVVLLGVITFLGVTGWLQPANTGQYGKPVFPFSEPSHLALILTPFLIFACVSSKPWYRLFYISAALLGAAALENLTMVFSCVLAALICLKPRHILLLALLLAPAIAALDLSYYYGRLEFDVESQNLSSLVYLQGWQMLAESLEHTNGLGLGFQQLGVFGTNVSASDQINLIMGGGSLNLLDGGFNMAKLLSELGVFGAMLIIVYIYYLIRAIRLLRRTALYGEQYQAVLLFSASCIVGYLIELLLRGIGYFTPTGILLVFSLLTLSRFEKPLNKTAVLLPATHIENHA